MKLALFSAVIVAAALPACGQLRAVPRRGEASVERALAQEEALSVAFIGHSSSSKSSKSSKGSKSTKGSKSDDMSMTSSKSSKGSKSSKSGSAKSDKSSKSSKSDDMSMTSSKSTKGSKSSKSGSAKSSKSDSAKSSKGSKSSKSDTSTSSKSAKSSKSSKSASADEPLECVYETPIYFIEEEGRCVKDADFAAMCAGEPVRRRLSSKSSKSSKSSTSSLDGLMNPANCANLFDPTVEHLSAPSPEGEFDFDTVYPPASDEWGQLVTCCQNHTFRNETITGPREACLRESRACEYQICGEGQAGVFGVWPEERLRCTLASVPPSVPPAALGADGSWGGGFGVYASAADCCLVHFNDSEPAPPFGAGTCQFSGIC